MRPRRECDLPHVRWSARAGRLATPQMNNSTRPAEHARRQRSPHDGTQREHFGPLTRDGQTPIGDTPEAHDEIIPQDLPKAHPGRSAAERQAAAGDGTTRGDV